MPDQAEPRIDRLGDWVTEENRFKRIDDILHKDAGCTSALDDTEESSGWLLLKYLEALDHDKRAGAALQGQRDAFILAEPFRWSVWAAPKTADGKLDHNAATTGDDLGDFVNGKLFPCLAGLPCETDIPILVRYSGAPRSAA